MWQIIFGAAIWVIFAIPVFEGVLNIGNAIGLTVGALLFFYGIFRKKLRPLIAKLRERKPWEILTNIFCVGVSVTLIYFCIGTGLVIYGMNNTPPEDTQVVVVLGCQVRPDGQPSTTLRGRLDAALEYLNENPETICIVTGGQGTDEVISEAECMSNYLIENGISEDRIIKEDMSSSTKENFMYTREILEERYGEDIPAVAAVTSNYHCFRSEIAAKKQGIKAYSIPASSPREMLPTYIVREVFGIIGEAFFR